MTRHNARAAIGLFFGLLAALMINGIGAGAAAVSTGEVVLR